MATLVRLSDEKYVNPELITCTLRHATSNGVTVFFDAENKLYLNAEEFAMLLMWCHVVNSKESGATGEGRDE